MSIYSYATLVYASRHFALQASPEHCPGAEQSVTTSFETGLLELIQINAIYNLARFNEGPECVEVRVHLSNEYPKFLLRGRSLFLRNKMSLPLSN